MTIKVVGHFTTFLFDSGMLLDAGSVVDYLSLEEQKKVDHIILTHPHVDHIRDLPLLVGNRLNSNYLKPLAVYGHCSTLRALKEHIFNNSIWPDFTCIPSKSSPILRLIELRPAEPESIASLWVYPVLMEHSVETFGYIIRTPENRYIAFTADTGPTENFWREVKEKDVKKIVVEVSYPDKMKDIALSTGHLCPTLLIEMLERYKITPEILYITHMKPQFTEAIKKELLSCLYTKYVVLEKGSVIEI